MCTAAIIQWVITSILVEYKVTQREREREREKERESIKAMPMCVAIYKGINSFKVVCGRANYNNHRPAALFSP